MTFRVWPKMAAASNDGRIPVDFFKGQGLIMCNKLISRKMWTFNPYSLQHYLKIFELSIIFRLLSQRWRSWTLLGNKIYYFFSYRHFNSLDKWRLSELRFKSFYAKMHCVKIVEYIDFFLVVCFVNILHKLFRYVCN